MEFFDELGVAVERVMTDNGPACRSRDFNTLLKGRGTRHKYTRPLSPWQIGKFVRMNRTLAQEWQYARAWESKESSAERTGLLHRASQLGSSSQRMRGLPPMSRSSA